MPRPRTNIAPLRTAAKRKSLPKKTLFRITYRRAGWSLRTNERYVYRWRPGAVASYVRRLREAKSDYGDICWIRIEAAEVALRWRPVEIGGAP